MKPEPLAARPNRCSSGTPLHVGGGLVLCDNDYAYVLALALPADEHRGALRGKRERLMLERKSA